MKRILSAVAWAVAFVAVAVGVGHAQSEPRFVLTGVVVVEGGGRAWLQEPQLTQNQPVSVRPGESIGPYRLTKVLEDRVEMMGPSGPLSVFLAGIAGPVTGAVATPPARPAPPPPAPVEPTTHEVVVLPPGPPLAPLPAGTPRVDFGSLLRGVTPAR